ncbi:MAG: hypothetical protein RBG13Loki_1124 [Promethearchaeota archaeon CR_4]|nr:MAG: hypothetical protein RBG13Loki_1124 [Candidatus Lokiarchaeota archaeon CR_4]
MSKKTTAEKSARKPNAQAKVKAPASKSLSATGVVSISLDSDAIQKLAFETSQLPKSYDDFVWIFAESELRLRPAYATGNNFKPEGPVQVYPAKIVDKPKDSAIKQLAEQMASQGTSVQDLHWFIAQRNFIYKEAKAMKK